MRKRAVSLLLALCLVVGIVPFAVPFTASARTVSDAVNWMNEHDGWCIDFDNAWGAQCVDLPMRYCHDLFGWNPGGDARDYRYNYLPPGWQRFQYKSGMIPQRGDIVVFEPSASGTLPSGGRFSIHELGHVGLVYSVDTGGRTFITQEQNIGEGDPLNLTTKVHRISRYYQGIWGFIRPPYTDNAAIPSGSSLTLDEPWVGYTTDDNAQIGSFIRCGGSAVYCSRFGLKVWEKSTGKLITDHKEDIPSSVQGGPDIKIWINMTNELGIKLKPGTEYTFQFSAFSGNKTFESVKNTFKTTGSSSKPVTIKFDTRGSSGAMQSVTVPYGDTYVVPQCKVKAPWGKTFAFWTYMESIIPHLLFPGDKLSTSKFKEGETITLSAVWNDNSTFRMDVVDGTKKVTKLTGTNAAFSVDLKVVNASDSSGRLNYTSHGGSLQKLNSNGTKVVYDVDGIPYTAEQYRDGVHTLTFDLSKTRIHNSYGDYHLEPGTKYIFSWVFYNQYAQTGDGAHVEFEFTTPASGGDINITGVTAKDAVYNGTAQPGYSGTPKAENFSGKISTLYTGRGGTAYNSASAPKNAGSYTVTFTADDNKSYGELSLDFTVVKASLTVTADNKNVPIGGSMPGLTYTVTGLAPGDTLATKPSVACTVRPDLNANSTYIIRASGAKAPAGGNYSDQITYIDGILNVYAGDEPSPSGLRLDQTELYLTPGSSAVLKPVLEPADTQVDHFIWHSDNESVAKVDGNGKVTGIRDGRMVVRATTSDGKLTASCVVVVGAWYQKAVDYVLRKDLMSGYGNGSFGPNDPLTRAQLAQILYNKEGRPKVKATTKFSDVKEKHWHCQAVSWAAQRNIVSGGTDGRFNPNGNVTKQDLVVILWRYAGSPKASGTTLKFSDSYRISSYAQDAMKWAAQKKIIDNTTGKFEPRVPATRAQVAQMLMNYLG